MDQQGKARIAHLNKVAEGVRTGGKGTQRRKKKVQRKTGNTDEKKIIQTLKGLGLNPLPNIEEVEMFKDDGTVLVIKNPKMHAATQSNTFLVVGNTESKKFQDVMSESDILAAMKAQLGAQKGGALDADDDIPDLVSGVNFEDAAKKDGSAAPAQETPK